MKNIYQIVTCAALCFAITVKLNAQFSSVTGTNSFESATVDKIGIGNFSNNSANILSVLHIDGNALYQTTSGEVFRTNGPTLLQHTGACIMVAQKNFISGVLMIIPPLKCFRKELHLSI